MVKKENEETKKFPCKLCSYQATVSRNLKRHVIVVHAKIKEHDCKVCKATFYQKGDLVKHIMADHA